MGVAVLVLGDSGSGKSTSLRNFEHDEVCVLNVMGKPMPFRKRLQVADHVSYATVAQALASGKFRAYVVDDAGYLMQLENFRRIKESGYAKFSEMALHFEQLIEQAVRSSPDTITYLMMHYDTDQDGRRRPRTIGRLLDEKFCIEGACPVVIQCAIQDGRHVFVTKGDGYNGAKAPVGMLPDVMDNDLKAVDTAIREYWGMGPLGGGDAS